MRCFIDPAWTENEIVELRNRNYSESYNVVLEDDEVLLLDAYLPPDTDNRTARPVVVFVHGGGFIKGGKRMGNNPHLCRALAQRGFAVVSIDYRLTGSAYNGNTSQ